MKRFWGIIFLFLATLFAPQKSYALDTNVRTVIVAGIYGTLIGTGMGLISYPFTKNVRGIFVGSSIGLYLGIIAGIYHIEHREDPGNPLRGYQFEATSQAWAFHTAADQGSSQLAYLEQAPALFAVN